MPSKLPWLAFMVLVATLLALLRTVSAADPESRAALVAPSAGCDCDSPVPDEPEEAPPPDLPPDMPEEERGGEEDSKEWDDIDTATMLGLGSAEALHLRGPPEHQDEQGEDHRWRDLKPPR